MALCLSKYHHFRSKTGQGLRAGTCLNLLTWISNPDSGLTYFGCELGKCFSYNTFTSRLRFIITLHNNSTSSPSCLGLIATWFITNKMTSSFSNSTLSIQHLIDKPEHMSAKPKLCFSNWSKGEANVFQLSRTHWLKSNPFTCW